MPLVPGIDYQIANVLNGPLNINDNQVSVATLFSFDSTNTKNVRIDFSIVRDTINQVGSFYISTDGTNVSYSTEGVDTAASGVVLSAALSGNLLEVQYQSTSSGHTGEFFYSLTKLST